MGIYIGLDIGTTTITGLVIDTESQRLLAQQTVPNGAEEYDWLRGSNEEYNELVVERAVQAIRDADQALQPVLVAADSGVEGRLAWNRRAIARDGRVRMPPPRWDLPLGPTWIRYLEGPIDPEVGVVCIQDYNLRMVGMLLHYTCHPVNVFPKPIVSADWPGAWVQQMQAAYGQQCVPLVLNGCCGNINPWAPYDPDHVPDHRRMGCMLAETTQRVAETVEFTDLQASAISTVSGIFLSSFDAVDYSSSPIGIPPVISSRSPMGHAQYTLPCAAGSNPDR